VRHVVLLSDALGQVRKRKDHCRGHASITARGPVVAHEDKVFLHQACSKLEWARARAIVEMAFGSFDGLVEAARMERAKVRVHHLQHLRLCTEC
jgi:hypothetical protein